MAINEVTESSVRFLRSQQEIANLSNFSTIGLDIDGPLFEIVWALFGAYTDTLSVEVGDFGGWLEWHASENDMGAGKKKAGYDGQLIAIESLGDLCRLIEISRERGVE